MKYTPNKKDINFIGIANVVKNLSKDKRTQIGAVIIGEDKQIISTGYNSFPRGIDDEVEERNVSPEKYFWISHAEVNAICNAALSGVSTKNSSIYLTCGTPCTTCCAAIINSGIKKVFCSSDFKAFSNSVWEDEHFPRSMKMLSEAGIEVNFY